MAEQDAGPNGATTVAAWYCRFPFPTGCAFYYRDVGSTIAYLLRQRGFAEHLVYEPVPEFDVEGKRVCTEMHGGDWW